MQTTTTGCYTKARSGGKGGLCRGHSEYPAHFGLFGQDHRFGEFGVDRRNPKEEAPRYGRLQGKSENAI